MEKLMHILFRSNICDLIIMAKYFLLGVRSVLDHDGQCIWIILHTINVIRSLEELQDKWQVFFDLKQISMIISMILTFMGMAI